MFRRFFTRGLDVKSFLKVQRSNKYVNCLAFMTHREDNAGVATIVLDREQVIQLRHDLARWISDTTLNYSQNMQIKIDGEGI